MKLLILESGQKGKGVYTRSFIPEGIEVLEFFGPLMRVEEVPRPLKPEEDHYLQVGEKVFRGPTGEEEDFVNHSCDPNTKVVIQDYDARLVALRDIKAGEEITFDYSTTSTDTPETWSMQCLCNSKRCRGRISGFHSMPGYTQAEYIGKDAIPEYLLWTLAED